MSIHKFRVHKTMSRPGVNESSEWDFIKMILTKDQGRSNGNKKWMKVRKSGCIELNWTHCCTGKFNTTLSLCRVLRVSRRQLVVATTCQNGTCDMLTSAKLSVVLRLKKVDLIYFIFLFIFYFLFYFISLFYIFRTTRVRVDRSHCHISHLMM